MLVHLLRIAEKGGPGGAVLYAAPASSRHAPFQKFAQLGGEPGVEVEVRRGLQKARGAGGLGGRKVAEAHPFAHLGTERVVGAEVREGVLARRGIHEGERWIEHGPAHDQHVLLARASDRRVDALEAEEEGGVALHLRGRLSVAGDDHVAFLPLHLLDGAHQGALARFPVVQRSEDRSTLGVMGRDDGDLGQLRLAVHVHQTIQDGEHSRRLRSAHAMLRIAGRSAGGEVGTLGGVEEDAHDRILRREYAVGRRPFANLHVRVAGHRAGPLATARYAHCIARDVVAPVKHGAECGELAAHAVVLLELDNLACWPRVRAGALRARLEVCPEVSEEGSGRGVLRGDLRARNRRQLQVVACDDDAGRAWCDEREDESCVRERHLGALVHDEHVKARPRVILKSFRRLWCAGRVRKVLVESPERASHHNGAGGLEHITSKVLPRGRIELVDAFVGTTRFRAT
mmetsp:Transcript_7834/g.22891  ORF Transcript_7834/g.22891 Transcript_7834/m.22891 type:complete len:458 (+) Transcript_7834:154-1527(+)